jgi:hypothetical protein
MNVIRKLRNSFLGVSDLEAIFSKRGFYYGIATTQRHLESVGTRFLKGYRLALELSDVDELSAALNREKKEFVGFAYEGAAMGKTILDILSIGRNDRLQKLIKNKEGNKHIYILHVGAGWGYARFPIDIEKKIESFHPAFRWLIIDGYGFHQAFFKTKKYVYEKRTPKKLKKEFSKHVFYQGVGRCLWFITCAEPHRILNEINGFDQKYQVDLWSGVGLAATYAGGVNKEVLEELKLLSGPYLPHLIQGSAFAATARQRAENTVPYNEMACKIITGISVEEAAAATDRCLAQVPPELSSEQQYYLWQKLIRFTICKDEMHETLCETTSA